MHGGSQAFSPTSEREHRRRTSAASVGPVPIRGACSHASALVDCIWTQRRVHACLTLLSCLVEPQSSWCCGVRATRRDARRCDEPMMMTMRMAAVSALAGRQAGKRPRRMCVRCMLRRGKSRPCLHPQLWESSELLSPLLPLLSRKQSDKLLASKQSERRRDPDRIICQSVCWSSSRAHYCAVRGQRWKEKKRVTIPRKARGDEEEIFRRRGKHQHRRHSSDDDGCSRFDQQQHPRTHQIGSSLTHTRLEIASKRQSQLPRPKTSRASDPAEKTRGSRRIQNQAGRRAVTSVDVRAHTHAHCCGYTRRRNRTAKAASTGPFSPSSVSTRAE